MKAAEQGNRREYRIPKNYRSAFWGESDLAAIELQIEHYKAMLSSEKSADGIKKEEVKK